MTTFFLTSGDLTIFEKNWAIDVNIKLNYFSPRFLNFGQSGFGNR
jgi:hypothetical protein